MKKMQKKCTPSRLFFNKLKSHSKLLLGKKKIIQRKTNNVVFQQYIINNLALFCEIFKELEINEDDKKIYFALQANEK